MDQPGQFNYDFQIKNQKELQFRDNDGGSNWVALRSIHCDHPI